VFFAGIPLHSNEQECTMPGMEGMDCCKKAAKAESLTPEVSSRAFVRALELFAKWNDRLRPGLSFRAHQAAYSDSSHSGAQPLFGNDALINSFNWGRQPPP